MSFEKIDFGFGVPVPAPRKLPKLPRTSRSTVDFGGPRAPRCDAPASIIATSLHDLAAHVVFATDNRLGLHDALVTCARSILATPIALSVEPSLPVAPPAPATPVKAKRARAPATSPDDNGFASWTDYQIKHSQKLKNVGPTCVVTFADGETCRVSIAQPEGKPVNAGRGLRLCVAAWQSRQGEKPITPVRARLGKAQEEGAGECKIEALKSELAEVAAERNTRNLNHEWPTPPAVTVIHFERNGETIARFNPTDANKAMGAAS